MERLTIDFETRSHVDITKTNAWTYSEHPSTDVICLAWKHSEHDSEAWIAPMFIRDGDYYGDCHTRGTIPSSLEYWITQTDLPIFAHNVAFEISIWENVMRNVYGWPAIHRHRWQDTQALANYLSLPARLDVLAKVVGLEGKDPRGSRLITEYSKLYLKTAKTEIPHQDLQAWVKYCIQDVETEEACDDWMGELPAPEQVHYGQDLDMNLRGLRLDVPGIHHAIAVVEQRKTALANAFRNATGLNPTQRDAVLQWLRDKGANVENLQADYLEKYLEDEHVPDAAYEAIMLRMAHSKASVDKLYAMLRNVGKDGRARFQTRYHGAMTGRNTGAGMQPLNFPRTYEDFEPDMVVRDIGHESPELLDAVYGSAMEAVSKALRHYIVAEEGSRFIVADFVSIEALILAVLAGETWKVEAFRKREPIYERTADIVYGLPPGTVTKATHPDERQVGKICELASGYQGSVGAWRQFDKSERFTDDEVRGIVKKWRAGHPATKAFWGALETAAIEVVTLGGEIPVGEHLHVGVAGSFMYIEAPNGKRIWHAEPELVMAMPGWHNEKLDEECAAGVCHCRPTLQLQYKSWKAGGWRKVRTYGGMLAEHSCQFVSRELLRAAQTRVIHAGYPVVLTVYDEIVAELSYDAPGSVQEMVAIMEQPVDWAAGWPYRAEGWEGRRYKK